MERLRQIAPGTYIAGQITLDDIEVAKAAVVVRIVNNRPDGEDAGQPTSIQVEQAARDAGLAYVHIPVSGMPTPDQVAAVRDLLADGKTTLLYCRSGMRSAVIWALASSAAGVLEPDAIRLAAVGAGYDLSRLPL